MKKQGSEETKKKEKKKTSRICNLNTYLDEDDTVRV